MFLSRFEVIIADEAHNMLLFPTFSPEPNAASRARDALVSVAQSRNALFIAISATPQILKNRYPIHEIVFDKSDLRQYSDNETKYFSNVFSLMNQLPSGKKGALYTASISQMKELESVARANGRNPICIWSMSNSKHPLTLEQQQAREYILENEAIPNQYDLFIFNGSAETALNIRSEIDFVIVNNSASVHITQARGRIRHDINTLYLPQKLNPSFVLDEKYLNHPLTPQEKREMRLSTGLKDSKGKPLAYAQLKQQLINWGYSWAENADGRIEISGVQ